MSNSVSILSEFLTKEELAAELRRNPLARPLGGARHGSAPDPCRPQSALSASERTEMACRARAISGMTAASERPPSGPAGAAGNSNAGSSIAPAEVKPITEQERGAHVLAHYGKSGRERLVFLGKTRAELEGVT